MRYLAIFWACLVCATALYFYFLSHYSYSHNPDSRRKSPVFVRGSLDFLSKHRGSEDIGTNLFAIRTDQTELESSKGLEETTEWESSKGLEETTEWESSNDLEETTKWETNKGMERTTHWESTAATNRDSSNHQKILIYTQGRSGSSFTGALLSASSSAFYVYEPFQRMKVDGVVGGIEKIIAKDPTQYNRAKSVLSDIFSCKMTKGQTKQNNRKLRSRKQSSRKICSHSNSIVVKTIRMRRAALEQWINHTDIKIVHLIRDPRGIVRSRRMGGYKIVAEQLCQNMLDDLKIKKSLPENRYILVKYEDLVDNPRPTLAGLYKHLQLPFTQEVEDYLFQMTHAKQKSGYFGLSRPSSFSHDAWKKSLKAKKVRIIEDQCKEFMETIGYKKFNGN